MSLSGVLLGLLSIVIVVIVLLLIGAVGRWILLALGFGPPGEIERLYLALVALIALYLLVALLFGLPMPIHVIRGETAAPVPMLAETPSIIAPER
jgi:ABC-type transport system involved in multi-copper enzyme maturation permease subunit